MTTSPSDSRSADSTQSDHQHPINLPVISSGRSTAVRPSRMSRWRAGSLIMVHLIMIAHVIHWLITGSTLSPIEPSEAMYTLNNGALNAGMVFFCVAILATLIFGRFVCGWGCHLIAYQDLCSWILKKSGIHPKPFRSRLLIFGPLALAIYMFVWPSVYRWYFEIKPPKLSNHFITTEYWATFPGPVVAVLTVILCGFVIVYFLGSKGFCTYACPYGGFFSLVDQVSTGNILVTDACEHCGHCTSACGSNVRVHEEVALYGKVVNPGCMKCMDCVTVCPNDALYFGFATPTLATRAKAPRNPKPYDFTLIEELFMVVIGVVSLLTYRGLYGQIPLLLSMGMGAMTAYLALKFVRLLRTSNVRFQNLKLKTGGKLSTSGFLFSLACVVYFLFTMHSATIRYQGYTGNQLASSIKLGDEIWMKDVNVLDKVDTILQQKIDRAIKKFEFVNRWGLLRTPSTFQSLIPLYMAKNELVHAEKTARQLILYIPERAELYRALAGILYKADRNEEAVEQYREALQFNPNYSLARNELCTLLMTVGRADDAVEEYRQAVVSNPASADDHYNLAMALLNQRKTEEAITHLTIAIELNPDSAPAHYNLGVATFMTGRLDEAMSFIQRSILLNPDDPDTHGFLAVILEQLGDTEGARKENLEAQRLQAIQSAKP